MKIKKLVFIPVVIFFLSLYILFQNHQQTGDWINKNIDLKDRNMIIVKSTQQMDLGLIENILTRKYGSVLVSDMKTIDGYGVIIEIDTSFEPDDVVNSLKESHIPVGSYSFETIGPVIEESFLIRIGSGLLIGFALTGIVMFVTHKNPIISFCTVLMPIADIIVVLAVSILIGIKINFISLISLLILIPYSIGMNLLLVESIKMKKESFKLMFTWPLTIALGLAVASFVSASMFLTNIVFLLGIGIVSDFIFTLVMNRAFERSE